MLPPILDGLADESEGVRQAALASGRTLVDLYALSALELLLPAVERGCAHENWRIRQSSVELLGDLLFKVPVASWSQLHTLTWSRALLGTRFACFVLIRCYNRNSCKGRCSQKLRTPARWHQADLDMSRAVSGLHACHDNALRRWRAPAARCGWRATTTPRAHRRSSRAPPSERLSARKPQQGALLRLFCPARLCMLRRRQWQ